MSVTIIDSMCGAGKTSWAIQTMNENLDKRYIYITPYLDEVKRVIEGCYMRKFYQPESKKGKGSKLTHFNNLLSRGCNIVSTHALFRNINEETLTLLKNKNYTLILDEVMNIIERIPIDKTDFRMLFNDGVVTIDDNTKKMYWNSSDKNYNGEFIELKNAIVNGDVYFVRNSLAMWHFPVTIFKEFQEIYIMTYLFKGQMQRYYYDMNDIYYSYKSVKNIDNIYELVEYKDANKDFYKKLINICDNEKLNMIGQEGKNYHPLSSTWFEKQVMNKTDALDVLKKNIYNYFTNICKSKVSDNGWTVYKDYLHKCKGKRYTKGFIAFNARATNEYKHKSALAYCINLYMNPIEKGFFIDRKINIDEDSWALAEMIQWIWRSRIRENKSINVYIPSSRMRNLMINWLSTFEK